MTTFLFKEFLSLVLGGVSLSNQHLSILDGHGNHVTLKAIEHAKEFRLNMITIPSHASHVL
jgi:hypothetical protein